MGRHDFGLGERREDQEEKKKRLVHAARIITDEEEEFTAEARRRREETMEMNFRVTNPIALSKRRSARNPNYLLRASAPPR